MRPDGHPVLTHLIDGASGELDDAGSVDVRREIMVVDDSCSHRIAGEADDDTVTGVQRFRGPVTARGAARDECIDLVT